jgi:hypothetical protein
MKNTSKFTAVIVTVYCLYQKGAFASSNIKKADLCHMIDVCDTLEFYVFPFLSS